MNLEYLTALKVIDNLRPLLSDMELMILESDNYDEIESIFTNHYSPHISYSLRRNIRLKRYEILLPLYPFEILDLDDNLGSLVIEFINVKDLTFTQFIGNMSSVIYEISNMALSSEDLTLKIQSLVMMLIVIILTLGVYKDYDLTPPQKLKDIATSKLQELTEYNKNLVPFTNKIKKLIA